MYIYICIYIYIYTHTHSHVHARTYTRTHDFEKVVLVHSIYIYYLILYAQQTQLIDCSYFQITVTVLIQFVSRLGDTIEERPQSSPEGRSA